MIDLIGPYLLGAFLLIGGVLTIRKGYYYDKHERKTDQKKGGYVVHGNGGFDEFLRYTLPYLPLWLIKIVYIAFGFFLLIIGIGMLFYLIFHK